MEIYRIDKYLTTLSLEDPTNKIIYILERVNSRILSRSESLRTMQNTNNLKIIYTLNSKYEHNEVRRNNT